MDNQPPIQVELANGVKYSFKPSRAYILAFDKNKFSDEDAALLNKALSDMGITRVVAVLVDGDPETAMRAFEDKKSVEGEN